MGDTFQINVLEEAQKNNKKVLLFWYPKDFTFVCPTELHAFQAALGEFEKRNTMVIGASCDTAEVHFAWLNTPKDNGGIEGVSYPLLADSNRNLAAVLDILDATEASYDEASGAVLLEGDNVTYRATYLIDEEGTVFHEGIKPHASWEKRSRILKIGRRLHPRSGKGRSLSCQLGRRQRSYACQQRRCC